MWGRVVIDPALFFRREIMSKYVLVKGQRTQPLVGIEYSSVNGIAVRKNISLVFEPGKEVETDLDVSSWVAMGIIETVEEDVVEAVVEEPVVEPEQMEEEKSESEGVVEEEEPVGDSDEPEDEEEEQDEEEDAAAGYYEADDGRFQCAYCDKKLKTEASIIRHIESKH